MKNEIDWPWPKYSQRAIHRVADLLATGRVNCVGSSVSKCFEEKWCEYLNRPYSFAVCNGTQALELALESLELEPGSEVITPARSFVATGSSILRNQLCPKFCDVDKRTQCVNLETVEPLITAKTKVVIVVHLGGWPAEIETLIEFCRKNKIVVIEDCSQAHGAKIGNKRVGSFADIGIFSFCVDKLISTGGEGGLIVCSDAQLADNIARLKDHGGLRDNPRSNQFRYQRTLAGTNSRMTTMQMMLGLEQLETFNQQLQKRTQIATKLRAAITQNPFFSIAEMMPEESPSWYRLYFSIENKATNVTHRQKYYCAIKKQLEQYGIPLASTSCPDISKEPMFQNYSNSDHSLAIGDELSTTQFALPTHPTISDDDLEIVLKRLRCFTVKV